MAVRISTTDLRRLGVPDPAPRRAGDPIMTGGMNKTESKFAEILEGMKLGGEIDDWAYESERFRLADNTWSKFDFRVTLPFARQNVFVEVKVARKDGSTNWTDDSAVKTKTIPELHPYVFFLAVYHGPGRWTITRLPSRRWGRIACNLDWRT